MNRRTVIVFFVTLAVLVATGACSGDDSSSGGAACPDDVPTSCPSKAPSYAKDVAPVIQTTCTPCHAPAGEQSNRILTDYAGAFKQRSAVLNQVHACRMPPSYRPQLTAEGRATLLAWLVCDAPNN